MVTFPWSFSLARRLDPAPPRRGRLRFGLEGGTLSSMRHLLASLVAVSTVIACSGSNTTDLNSLPDAATDGTTGDGAVTDASSADVGRDGFPGACTPDGGFPNFQKGCGTIANCIIKLHQIDCCGSAIAIGINHGEFAAFDAAEAEWRNSCPKCGCPAMATLAENGKTGLNADVKVACDNGVCRTSL